MSSVFSSEPEGMTRAWPIVPLMSRKTRPTQNQAMISRWILVFTGKFASSCFFFFSAFTFHHHRPLCGRGFTAIAWGMFAGLDVGSALAHFQLHQIRGINARITRRTEPARGITDRAAQGRQRNVAQRISAKEFADFLGRVGRGDQLFARGRVHAVVAGRNRRRATDAHVNFFRADFTDHADDFAAGSAAHNGVVDKYYTLTFDQAANG